MRKYSRLLILFIISIMLISMLPLTVQAAEDDVLVIFRVDVDPRIKAAKQSIYIEFANADMSIDEYIYLRPESGYEKSIYLPKGEYSIYCGMVVGDYALEYSVSTPDFKAIGLTTIVKLTAGDVEYDGEVEENKHNLPGTIDREKTNELLIKDGKKPIDWDLWDEAHDPNAPYNPDNPYMGKPMEGDENLDGIPDEWQNEDGTLKDEYYDKYWNPSDDDDDDNNDNNNDDDNNENENNNTGNENNGNENNGEQNNNTQQQKNNTASAIIFVVVMIVGCGGIVLWRMAKKSDI